MSEQQAAKAGGGRIDRRRYRETVGLAVRFALQLWWEAKTGRLRPKAKREARQRALYTAQARRFRDFATTKGGLIIKLGQFLSVRIDVLPKEYIDELGQLQDAIPAVPTPIMTDLVQRELGRPLEQLYAEFDPEPLAAASLGQVHRAKLASGEDVAVKILRPGIDALIDTDVRSLRSIMRLLDRFTTVGRYMDVEEFCQDFENTFRDELDYIKEGRNAETFQRNFLTHMGVEMPQIYWSHTTSRVLTMEFMGGCKINDIEQLDAWGVDKSAVAENLLAIYLQMFLRDGFFHADPHPGNVFVRPDGIIQLIDFGMVGTLPDDLRRGLTDLIVALLKKDPGGIINVLQRMGFLTPGADTAALRRALMPLVDLMIGQWGTLFQGASYLDLAMQGTVMEQFHVDKELLDDIREVILTQPISLPGNITFLGKALITVVVDCFKLDPKMDIMAVARPYVLGSGGLAGAGSGGSGGGGIGEVLSLLWQDGWGLVKALPATANHLVSLAQKLDDGDLEVRLTEGQLRRLELSARAQTRKLVRAIGGATGFLGALMVWLHRRQR
ncbi:MAG: AarF/ABC1/UbiB kinase family protein [Bifidobacteriaceae bacterium]|jgi:predicted unusual protein kinase regulating ubiquinone biosynthesis (AarF/ABC1/UbiB family)|nr:AarF/ABC1/UbiB kinase family protein [Bifidobacteriaceae bacterium]